MAQGEVGFDILSVLPVSTLSRETNSATDQTKNPGRYPKNAQLATGISDFLFAVLGLPHIAAECRESVGN